MPKDQDITLCLGHGPDDKPNGCPKAGECRRHLALRSREFPADAPIIGCACVKSGFKLFVGLEHETSAE